MKNKIFKYRIIGVLIFLVESFISVLFAEGTYVSFDEMIISEGISLQNMLFPFALIIFFSSILCLISLLLKAKKTVLFLNINYSIILFFFVFCYIKVFIENSYVGEDIYKFIMVFTIIFVLLFVVNFFRYREIDYLEIDEIGKPN